MAIKTHVGTLVMGVIVGGGLVWIVDTAARDNANDLQKSVYEKNGEIKELTAEAAAAKADLETVRNELSARTASLDTPVSTRQSQDNKCFLAVRGG